MAIEAAEKRFLVKEIGVSTNLQEMPSTSERKPWGLLRRKLVMLYSDSIAVPAKENKIDACFKKWQVYCSKADIFSPKFEWNAFTIVYS